MDFAACSQALCAHGLGWPLFVIDRSRLDANVERLGQLARGARLRLVVKSLPCPALLERLMAALDTQRLMLFHLPFLIDAIERWPQADIMLGKPLPAAAVGAFYQALATSARPDAMCRPRWLIDTPDRARMHAAMARQHDIEAHVVIELDVGMHRGGIDAVGPLRTLLDAVAAEVGVLRLDGFMAYDAHAGKGAPWCSRRRALAQANQHCLKLVSAAQASHPGLVPADPLINGAGSPTCVYHTSDSPLTELAVGSIVLKPAEFDLPQLSGFRPAAWLAAPVLKRLRGVRIPFLEALSRLSRRDTLFIYGGRWPARPCWPQGLRDSALYGPSFNQQFLSVPRRSSVAVDDFVFFRPLQSEQVMLWPGEVVLVDGEQVVSRWSTLGGGHLTDSGAA
ncbi:MAG: DSD1 family PLP-dependent enzyme [Pseudomonadota bacterium]|nr:MAG: DSD1 family PLP-dependent enzyme [Pseudomonadota bacterium]